ncbi:MAG TPA: glycine zipper 2TM domain-containing protein [Usitatibacter sp.]|nr:glycine zipper 2TM domain-containing protein [Usitatibacter sp.]
MLNRKLIAAAAAGLVVTACGSDPYSYSEPRYVSSGSYAASNVAYDDFGRVVAIDVVRGGGRSTGAGAVVGGIVGGVLGHQVGSGRGNDAATVAGAVGGAVVGNEIEKRRDDGEQYRVVVQFRDGREATFMQDSLEGIRVGDRVRVDGGRLFRG